METIHGQQTVPMLLQASARCTAENCWLRHFHSPFPPVQDLIQHSVSLSGGLNAGLSTLQQAAALGYPSTVYVDRPAERCRLPPWAWLMVAIAALSILVAGLAFPSARIPSLPEGLYVECLHSF